MLHFIYTGCLRPHVHSFYLGQSILEKNVSDKSRGVLNDPFSDLISLTLMASLRSEKCQFEFFKWNPQLLLHILIAHLESFPNTIIKYFSIKYFLSYKA